MLGHGTDYRERTAMADDYTNKSMRHGAAERGTTTANDLGWELARCPLDEHNEPSVPYLVRSSTARPPLPPPQTCATANQAYHPPWPPPPTPRPRLIMT